MSTPVSSLPALTIAAVERDVGLPKDTLRVWERRYGFPTPLRDAHGERLYPADQVDKLKLLRRLVDRGQRPGRIVGLDVGALTALLADLDQAKTPSECAPAEPVIDELILLLQARGPYQLSQRLSAELIRVGLQRFVVEIAAPLTAAIGESWARNELAVFEEHLFSEQLTTVLRGALSSLPQAADHARPRVLLTTLPLELHMLGLLMAEVMLTLGGAHCTSLGPQTPIAEIVAAARAQQTDIVALSFSSFMTRNQVALGLAELRSALPRYVKIWVGGSNPALQRDLPDGVSRVTGLEQVAQAIADWRDHTPDASL